nr:MAG TPA: hypothetical protein [Bacteriophage sp.]
MNRNTKGNTIFSYNMKDSACKYFSAIVYFSCHKPKSKQ